MSSLIFGFTINDLSLMVLWAPLLASLLLGVIAILSARSERDQAMPVVMTLGIGAPALSLLVTALMVFMLDGARDGMVIGPIAQWLPTALGQLDIAFWLDPLAFLLALFVSFIALMLCLFGLDEVSKDPGARATRLAFINLGLFACLGALWSESITVFFFFWELAALTSFFLLRMTQQSGVTLFFWLSRGAAAVFLLGIIALIHLFAQLSPDASEIFLSFAALADHPQKISQETLVYFLVPIVIFCAQLPFCSWLFRAGQCKSLSLAGLVAFGPPSLGVYLLARTHFLTMANSMGLLALELLGAITALIAALLACYQGSWNRILAYSAVSQIAVTFVAFGLGAVPEGLVHWLITTLAAVIILGALMTVPGSRSRRPVWFFILMFIAVATLIGVLPFPGFMSRMEILWHAFRQERYFTWALLLGSSVLTAIYASRFLAYLFFKEARGSEAKRVWSLAGRSRAALAFLGIGLMALSFVAWPESFFGPNKFRAWILPVFEDHLPIRSEIYGWALQWILFGVVTGLLYLTAVLTIRRVQKSAATLDDVELVAKPRFAEMFILRPSRWVVDVVLKGLLIDKFQDGVIVEGCAAGLRLSGKGLLKLQTGLVQHYLFWMLVGVAALIAWVLL